jgi:hypothetical protein
LFAGLRPEPTNFRFEMLMPAVFFAKMPSSLPPLIVARPVP